MRVSELRPFQTASTSDSFEDPCFGIARSHIFRRLGSLLKAQIKALPQEPATNSNAIEDGTRSEGMSVFDSLR